MEVQDTTCRGCLKPSGSISVFDRQDAEQHCDKIMRWTSIVISAGDGLPSLICANCVELLKIAHEFFFRCEASDRALRSAEPPETIKFEVKEEFDIVGDIKFEDGTYMYDVPSVPSRPNNLSYEPLEPVEKPIKVKKKGNCRGKKKKMGPIQCTICGILVSCPSALQVHLRAHTGEKPFQCSQCSQRYKSRGALKRHAETRHLPRERRFTCETCGASFYRKNEIIQHIRRHTGERPHACPFCSQRFLQISSLIRHKRIHTGDKPYACPACGKAFPDRGSLTKHSAVHSAQRNHLCHLCDKAFKLKNSLNVHIASIHSNAKNSDDAIVCNYCGATFSVKGNLTVHIQRKHSEKSGQCTVCFKPFSDLEAHMRKHTGEKPFICDLCNRGFSRKSCLANHWLFKHRNAEKYKCSLGGCLRSFPTAPMLEFHLLKQHTQRTPHVCPQCARGFYRACDLSRHLRVTHMCVRTEKSEAKPITS